MVTTEIVGYVHLKEAAKSLFQSSDGFIRLLNFFLSVCTFTKVVDLFNVKITTEMVKSNV